MIGEEKRGREEELSMRVNIIANIMRKISNSIKHQGGDAATSNIS